MHEHDPPEAVPFSFFYKKVRSYLTYLSSVAQMCPCCLFKTCIVGVGIQPIQNLVFIIFNLYSTRF
jgi:hypothetical protein